MCDNCGNTGLTEFDVSEEVQYQIWGVSYIEVYCDCPAGEARQDKDLGEMPDGE